MDLVLNVYEGRKVQKTYTAETYDLMYGTVEDVIEAVDLDALSDESSDVTVAAAAAKLVTNGMGQIKPLLKDIFPGLTDDELKRVKVKDIVSVVVAVIRHTVEEVMQFGGDGKNK